ncbi:unnamed protein product, partial [Brassica rapa subsp. trilocularis]
MCVDSRVQRKFKGYVLTPNIGYGVTQENSSLVFQMGSTRSCLLHDSFEDGLTRSEVIAHSVSTKKSKEIVERVSQLDVVVSNRLARLEPRKQVGKKIICLTVEVSSLLLCILEYSYICFHRLDSTHAPPEEK